MNKSTAGIISNSSPSLAKQSILVVDDNSDALDLSKTVLEIEGYEVFTAQSGVEAIAALSKAAPNLILLDMQLGDMTGAELLEEIEEKHPEIIQNVPVVFLTGMDDIPKSKAVGYIRKPADMTEFLKAIRNFISVGQDVPLKH